MKLLFIQFKGRKLLFLDILIVLAATCYFLFFVNKGIILSDEGYYVHYAERIVNGELAYRDFVLQYSPGYFYLLAFLYKMFGVQLLVGRFLSLFLCIAILIATLYLLRVCKINAIRVRIISALLLITLTYSLLHVPIVVWFCVLIAVLLSIFIIKWLRSKRTRYIVVVGLLLSAALLFKQNLGLFFIIVTSILVVAGSKGNIRNKLQPMAILNSIWLLILGIFVGIYYIQAHSLDGIFLMFVMSRQFIETYAFSYPSLTLLFQPTGLFKLLPYYFPIVYLLVLGYFILTNKVNYEKVVFSVLALTGFFGTVYPASDLLHVYPFLGITLVSTLVVFYKWKKYNMLLILMIVFVFFGIYMTFFMKSYRYEGYFLRETTPLNLPKTKGIQVDYNDPSRSKLVEVYNFFQKNTNEDDYIFVYPFAPMMYYILDRKNPNGIVQYVLLEAPETLYSEKRVLKEIKEKRVQYILTVGPYTYDRKISQFIQKQKLVYKTESYAIFEIVNL